MFDPPPQPQQKRSVNLSMSAEAREAARKAGVNLSALLERALAAELALLKRLQWREENAHAIEAYNRHLEQHGACFEGRWGE
jgi:antitoxin CcdA